MARRIKFKRFKRPSFRRLRSSFSYVGRRFRSFRKRRFRMRRRNNGGKKIFGFQPMHLAIAAVLAYLFIAPVKTFVNGIFKK